MAEQPEQVARVPLPGGGTQTEQQRPRRPIQDPQPIMQDFIACTAAAPCPFPRWRQRSSARRTA